MCSYGDYMEENGAIVALDQEKAYDKIDHSYLLDTLRTFHLPDLFIDTVKALYDHARTKVAINGVMSDHYPVTRGVRQGDPLSCLLFNLAIEPLAASIRNSPDLEGFSIPGTTSKVTVNLYADDTTVYLSESDRYDTLEHILTQWCRASGVKFNTEKTEIIPIGTKQHRERILTTRRLHPDDHPLPENIRVAPDGHPTRCLGAWIGNDLDSAQPWTPTIEKIKRALDRWTQTNPSLDAKRLIIQLTVGSMTQFLTKAQGMPKTILKTLTKLTRDFIWNQRKSRPIALNRLCSPRHEGGINLLDLTLAPTIPQPVSHPPNMGLCDGRHHQLHQTYGNPNSRRHQHFPHLPPPLNALPKRHTPPLTTDHAPQHGKGYPPAPRPGKTLQKT